MKENSCVAIILLHYEEDKDNKVLQPILTKALKNGEIFPADYAAIVDRRLVMTGTKPQYFEVPFGYDKLSKQEKEEVDRARIIIGLSTMNDSRLVVQKEGRVVVYDMD